MNVTLDGESELTKFYISSAPKEFCASNRTNDIDALLHTINSAKKTVDIQVMTYFPAAKYTSPTFYWPVIDDALRNASFRGVSVRFMVAKWAYTSKDMAQYLKSLAALNNIQVKYYVVPGMTDVENLPYTRVNHAKFVVTDQQAYISTSNWSADYFLSTAGLSSVIKSTSFVSRVQVLIITLILSLESL